MIQLKDKDGKEITVTNLREALKQVDSFRQYAHNDKAFERFDKQQQAYWQDLYEKLQKRTD